MQRHCEHGFLSWGSVKCIETGREETLQSSPLNLFVIAFSAEAMMMFKILVH